MSIKEEIHGLSDEIIKNMGRLPRETGITKYTDQKGRQN